MAPLGGFSVPLQRLLPIGRTGNSARRGGGGTPYVPAPAPREAFRITVVAFRCHFEAPNPGIKGIPWEQEMRPIRQQDASPCPLNFGRIHQDGSFQIVSVCRSCSV